MSFDEALQGFQDNRDTVVTTPAALTPEQLSKRMRYLIDKIIETPNGVELVSFLLEHDVPVQFALDTQYAVHRTTLVVEGGRLMPEKGKQHIAMNPLCNDALLISAFLHEARHAQQCLSGMSLPDTQVSPHHLAIYTRMLEADAQSDAVVKAFKMKLAGDSSVFDAGRMIGYGDMYLMAEAAYAHDPSSLDDGRLRRVVFDAWFSDRDGTKYGYDEASLNGVWPFFCAHADHAGFDRAPLSAEFLEKLGTVGGEKVNYLTLPGFRSLSDPYYTEGFSASHHIQLLEMTRDWIQPSPQPASAKPAAPGMRGG